MCGSTRRVAPVVRVAARVALVVSRAAVETESVALDSPPDLRAEHVADGGCGHDVELIPAEASNACDFHNPILSHVARHVKPGAVNTLPPPLGGIHMFDSTGMSYGRDAARAPGSEGGACERRELL